MHKGKVIWMIVAVLAVLLALMTAMRWKAWFSNPPEPPYTAPMQPERVLLTIGNDMYSRNVSWVCDSVVKPSFVEYCINGDTVSHRVTARGEVFVSRNGKAAYYYAELDGQALVAQEYEYRVCTAGRYSEWYSFRMPDRNSGNVRILYFGDIQDTLGGEANLWLKRAMQLSGDVDFIICGGDLVERPTDTSWKQTFVTLDSIGQHIPVMTITGNHDFLKGIHRKLERRFALTHSFYLNSEDLQQYTAVANNNMIYRLKYKNLDVHFFDSNRGWKGLWQQRQWFEDSYDTSATWHIVVTHHPMYSVRGKTRNLRQRIILNPLMKDVDLVLQGHEHAYARMHRGKTMYTISHMSPKKYKVNLHDKRYDIVDTSGRCFQIIECTDSTLSMKAMNLDGKMLDSFTLKR